MASGLPTLVSRENGTVEIIQHGVNGLILEDPADSTSLAAMLRQLADDSAFASRIAAKGAETARQFTWERNVDEVRAIFAQVLARNDRSPEREAASHVDPGRSAASK